MKASEPPSSMIVFLISFPASGATAEPARTVRQDLQFHLSGMFRCFDDRHQVGTSGNRRFDSPLRDRFTDGLRILVVAAYLKGRQDEAGYYKVMFESASSRKHQDKEGLRFAYQLLMPAAYSVVSWPASTSAKTSTRRNSCLLICSQPICRLQTLHSGWGNDTLASQSYDIIALLLQIDYA
jgi:hypothetical protein